MLDDLWNAATWSAGVFRESGFSEVPEPARAYLRHAIAQGTPLASAVCLRMRGEIKIGRWFPFTAEQVIHVKRGFVWVATVRLAGLPIFHGFDRLVDGTGEMRWKLFGLVPVVTGAGPDITRSATGRADAESIWLPPVLAQRTVSWSVRDPEHVVVTPDRTPDTNSIEFSLEPTGRVRALKMLRWGNPGGGAFRLETFGGVLESERTFGRYTIPTCVRVGWYFGSPRFESEGEFFRAVIEDATYRP